MAEVAVIGAGDMGQLAHLLRRQNAIGHGDAQHIGVQLQIETVHQAQGLELILAELARQAACHLIGELGIAVAHKGMVERIVLIHIMPRKRQRG